MLLFATFVVLHHFLSPVNSYLHIACLWQRNYICIYKLGFEWWMFVSSFFPLTGSIETKQKKLNYVIMEFKIKSFYMKHAIPFISTNIMLGYPHSGLIKYMYTANDFFLYLYNNCGLAFYKKPSVARKHTVYYSFILRTLVHVLFFTLILL